MDRRLKGCSAVVTVVVTAMIAAVGSLAREPAPAVYCAEPVFDFGRKMDSARPRHEFTIENRGDLTLQLGKIYSGCGCTTEKISSRSIRPGKSAKLGVVVNLSGRRGEFEKEISLETNDPDCPALALKLRGEVVPSIDIDPRHIFFRRISRDEAATEVCNISFNAAARNIERVESEAEFLRAELEEVEPGHRYRVAVSTVPPLQHSSRNGDIRVLGDSGKLLFKIPVWLQIVDAVQIAPAELLVYGDETPSATRHLILRKGKIEDFKVLGVDLPVDDAMRAEVFKLGSYGYRIKVDNIPAEETVEGKLIVIRTDANSFGRIEVPIRYRQQRP